MNPKICSRCSIDSTVAGARFDPSGECNYCKMHDELDRTYPLNGKGRKNFEHLMATIQENSRDKPYDCVVGIAVAGIALIPFTYSKKWGSAR